MLKTLTTTQAIKKILAYNLHYKHDTNHSIRWKNSVILTELMAQCGIKEWALNSRSDFGDIAEWITIKLLFNGTYTLKHSNTKRYDYIYNSIEYQIKSNIKSDPAILESACNIIMMVVQFGRVDWFYLSKSDSVKYVGTRIKITKVRADTSFKLIATWSKNEGFKRA